MILVVANEVLVNDKQGSTFGNSCVTTRVTPKCYSTFASCQPPASLETDRCN